MTEKIKRRQENRWQRRHTLRRRVSNKWETGGSRRRAFLLVEILPLLVIMSVIFTITLEASVGADKQIRKEQLGNETLSIATSVQWYLDNGYDLKAALDKVALSSKVVNVAGDIISIEDKGGLGYVYVQESYSDIVFSTYHSKKAYDKGREPLAVCRIVLGRPSSVEVEEESGFVNVNK